MIRLLREKLTEPISYLVVFIMLTVMGCIVTGVAVYGFISREIGTVLGILCLIIGCYMGVFYPLFARYCIKNSERLHARCLNMVVNPVLWKDEQTSARCLEWQNRNKL